MRRAAAAVLCAACFVVGLPHALATAFEWIRAGVVEVRDDPRSARRRALGLTYAEGIEAVERAIPGDASYFAVDADPQDRRELSWIRFDLAPRKGIYFGKLRGFRRFPVPLAEQVERPPYVVISYGEGRPAEAVRSGDFFGVAPPRGRRDEGIPGHLDAPAGGSEVRGELAVDGWCQERGSRPCPVLRVLLDGRELPPRSLARQPRPDVAAAIAGMGDVSRAGFRAALVVPPGQAGEHDVAVIGETEDGRWRRFGPNVFRWAP